MVSRFEKFSFTISGIHGAIQKIERDEMEKYGLKGAYAQYLIAMNHFPQGITATHLGEICDKDKAAVSRVVSELQKKGLLQKEGANENGYRALLKLSKEGRKAADFVSQRARTATEIAGNGLTDSARQALYEALDLIATNLQSICKEGIPESTP